MKPKFFILLIIGVIINFSANAQKIKKNVIDKFTNIEEIETSWETLYTKKPMLGGYTHKFGFLIRRYNGVYVMVADILMKDIKMYTEDSGVTFLLENGETIFLKTNYTGIGSKSFGKGYYFSTSFRMTNDDILKFKQNKITDVRIHFLGGYFDKEILETKKDLIQKMLHLFDNL